MPRKKQTEHEAPPSPERVAVGDEPTSQAEEVARVTLPGGRVVVFRLGDQSYALPIDVVQEIQQIVEFTPVPDSAPALVGMIDVRGRIVPAIDVRVLVGLDSRQYTLDTPMILCRAHGRLVALVVDEVDDVITLPDGSIQAPSKLYALADRMIGICVLESGLVIVLDPERLVPDTSLAATDNDGGGLDL